MNIRFFDLRNRPLRIIKDGEEVDLLALVTLISTIYPSLLDHNRLSVPQRVSAISPIYDHNPQQWNEMISLIVCLISGHIPTRLEIKTFRTAIDNLRRNIKLKNESLLKIVDTREFVFGSFPYIVSGFEIVSKCLNYNNRNNAGNFASSIIGLLEKETCKISTILCAHRESDLISPNSLVEEVDPIGIRKARNLLLGILENLPNHKQAYVEALHLRGTEWGPNGVFPSVFISYFRRGSIPNLLLLLESHYSELQRRFFLNHRDIKIRLMPLDQHMICVEQDAENRFGGEWRITGKGNLYSRATSDKLSEIAYHMTLAEINRLMPYYQKSAGPLPEHLELNISQAKAIAREHRDFKIVPTTEKAIDLFFRPMSACGKAIYETLFYYRWGRYCAEKNFIGVGFDRDHDLFQTTAFEVGYHDHRLENQADSSAAGNHAESPAPLIYARRHAQKTDDGSLNTLSFRQFWRKSESYL